MAQRWDGMDTEALNARWEQRSRSRQTVVGTRPDGWGELSIEYRFGRSVYAVTVHDPARVRADGAEVSVDGRPLDSGEIPLVDDGARHEVAVRAKEVPVRLRDVTRNGAPGQEAG